MPLLIPLRQPRRSTLFPYTTLFRSFRLTEATTSELILLLVAQRAEDLSYPEHGATAWTLPAGYHHVRAEVELERSEEHTSELQSHVNLVCRLLLEKKKSCYERCRPS